MRKLETWQRRDLKDTSSVSCSSFLELPFSSTVNYWLAETLSLHVLMHPRILEDIEKISIFFISPIKNKFNIFLILISIKEEKISLWKGFTCSLLALYSFEKYNSAGACLKKKSVCFPPYMKKVKSFKANPKFHFASGKIAASYGT